MATFTHSLQGTTPTTIAATDKLQFAGGTFDSKITVDEYNDSTHVKTDTDADKSSANTPRNNKFVSMSGGGGSKSQVSIDGASAIDLDAATTANCALKINFANDPAVATSEGKFYAYDGTTTTDAPDGMLVHAAEQGATKWSEEDALGVAGSGKAISLGDSASATSHDFFILISAKPTSVGAKSGKYRVELTYS